ncbi:MAG: prohibitin family protein [Clostridia bacterium]|jgi:regulator of protease activity HflC (stomatin/prohibitin superfamily)|nr:MAG TPA: High frequency of lysogenization C protein [Caudoviricetes sp.]DAP86622.1 MAG TPA: High frequency of lysogenization C protein [Caudoviricetes sp.]
MYMETKTKIIIGSIVGVIVIAMIILVASITTVPTGYVGVKTRFGQVQDDVIQEGFNLKAPFIESIVKIDCRTQKYEIATEASSKDLQKISNLKVVVNYNVDKNNANNLYKEVGKDYQTVLIEPAILESIKQGISQYTAEETITKRSEVADVIINLLKNKLENKGVTVTALNITDLSFSEEFDTAVEQKQIVEQETQKAQYELEKAKVENEKKIENAKADAEVMRQQNEQITDNYLRLKEIENEQKAIEKWNGQLPTTTSDAIPFINVN